MIISEDLTQLQNVNRVEQDLLQGDDGVAEENGNCEVRSSPRLKVCSTHNSDVYTSMHFLMINTKAMFQEKFCK